MNGYFGSLLRQTGIAVRKQPEIQGPFSEQPSAQAEQSNAPQPFEIEEHSEVVQPSVPVEISDRVPETWESQPPSAISNPAPTRPAVPQSPPQISRETECLSPAPSPEMPQQDLGSAAKVPVTPATSPTVAGAGTEERYRSTGATEKLPSIRSAKQPATAEQDAVQQRLASGPHSRHPSSVHPVTRTTKPVINEQVWKTAFKQVRQWVASQPVQTTREQRDQIAGKAVDAMQKETLIKLQARAVAGTTNWEDTRSTDAGREGIQELRLSIGKIEISLEQPRQQDRHSTQAADRIAPKPAPERPSSRLRRHYLVP